MISKRNHLHYIVPFFINNSPPPRQLLNTKYLGRILIEQITEFQLRKPGPLGRTCTPITVFFYVKIKISKRTSSSGLLFIAKVLQEAMHLTSSYLGQITYNQNLTLKCKILNVSWT